mmetsp:Transcript_28283/g.74203  ORF Transcript_28283/g.74203 Transcript_28283/m.74203 type:complete len:154 (+) Transcript_28283:77-538(+)|eukprot:CAMPEP_0182924752 /NCGR_PEP_ID=MMETSP0105_2-20130417/7227_1 /TAXON_ID=81532 ORGANISM="Acanthoeca-like sp., Strain 10tr" /NCGR_SAMPLE_ID=MMETSP0105_2 /ASSEMBLY_ACC=CAM_ASM_000205 /LENGTH=153 /DNA_ID=CAMNT_0025062555 /DNA_START=70 /DNA_END=531 /DNA_ORIENTATION=+
MAAEGEEVPPVEAEGEAPAEVEAAPAAPVKMDLMTALQEVLKTALTHDGLARGLHEAAKALDKRQAHLCVLAKDCDEKNYEKLVEALCTHHEIYLIRVESKLKLGEWAGLCKIDRDGTPRKIVGCSCVVVKDYGSSDSEALDILLDHVKGGGN